MFCVLCSGLKTMFLKAGSLEYYACIYRIDLKRKRLRSLQNINNDFCVCTSNSTPKLLNHFMLRDMVEPVAVCEKPFNCTKAHLVDNTHQTLFDFCKLCSVHWQKRGSISYALIIRSTRINKGCDYDLYSFYVVCVIIMKRKSQLMNSLRIFVSIRIYV